MIKNARHFAVESVTHNILICLSLHTCKIIGHASLLVTTAQCLQCSVFFVDDNENDDENDEIVSNFRRRD